jgi:hypothetical protein
VTQLGFCKFRCFLTRPLPLVLALSRTGQKFRGLFAGYLVHFAQTKLFFTRLCSTKKPKLPLGWPFKIWGTRCCFISRRQQSSLSNPWLVYCYWHDLVILAGDAILAIWTVKDKEDLPGAVYRAIKCALSIQRNFSEWETDVGVTLRVKIGWYMTEQS